MKHERYLCARHALQSRTDLEVQLWDLCNCRKMYLGAGNSQASEENGEGLHVADVVVVVDDAAQPNLRVKIAGHTTSFYTRFSCHFCLLTLFVCPLLLQHNSNENYQSKNCSDRLFVTS